MVVQRPTGAAVVGDAGFGAYTGAGQHKNLTRPEQARNALGGVPLVVRFGGIRHNALNRANRSPVHGGDFFTLFTGGDKVLVVSPAVHFSPMLCALVLF